MGINVKNMQFYSGSTKYLAYIHFIFYYGSDCYYKLQNYFDKFYSV